MGFWHTGYLEFHDEADLSYTYQSQQPIYHCQHCDLHFDSMDDLRRHRFESHPYLRPQLFVRGVELGATPFRVTRLAKPSEFVVERCTNASFNGKPTKPEEIPKLLSKVNNDRVTVKLTNDGPPAVFELVFKIAEEQHIKGVEASFVRFTNRKELSVKALEGFIKECKAFNTADTYYSGICDYLYGVMSRERRPDSRIPYAQYPERFNQAADALMDYNRPLAHIVRSLVAFHFNHFENASIFSPSGRLHMAAIRFDTILKGGQWDKKNTPAKKLSNVPEDLLTDHETLRILRWIELPLSELATEAGNISALVKRDITEFDRLKLNILLTEAYTANGNFLKARNIARELITNPKTSGWAERSLIRLPGKE
ncbi:MAG: hypothetical protein KGI54_07605 [Pseudomonadota bacterium]|nr:hypothetical protein [Pseudomonadota bacterium]